MRSLIVAALLAVGLVAPCAAERVARSGSAELRLLDTACSHGGTLAHIKPEWREKFKNARLLNGGKIQSYGCWILADENTIFVMYEDADFLEIPPHLFEEVGA